MTAREPELAFPTSRLPARHQPPAPGPCHSERSEESLLGDSGMTWGEGKGKRGGASAKGESPGFILGRMDLGAGRLRKRAQEGASLRMTGDVRTTGDVQEGQRKRGDGHRGLSFPQVLAGIHRQRGAGGTEATRKGQSRSGAGPVLLPLPPGEGRGEGPLLPRKVLPPLSFPPVSIGTLCEGTLLPAADAATTASSAARRHCAREPARAALPVRLPRSGPATHSLPIGFPAGSVPCPGPPGPARHTG